MLSAPNFAVDAVESKKPDAIFARPAVAAVNGVSDNSLNPITPAKIFPPPGPLFGNIFTLIVSVDPLPTDSSANP